jgi:type IV pilus assembly protein PilC
MPWFVYTGINPHGHEIHGEEFGTSEGEITNRLHGNGISVIKIGPKSNPLFAFDIQKILNRVSRKELKFFYVNLSTLITSGCSLRASLASLGEQADNPYFGKVLNGITASIEAGKSFSESLKEFPDVFPPLFVHLIKAGEEGGMLDSILLRYAVLVEKQEKIQAKVRGALILPFMMIAVAFVVTMGLLVFVFPEFMKIFKGKEAHLPAPTKMVMTISGFFVDQYKMLFGQYGMSTLVFRLGLVGLIGYGIYRVFQTPGGHRLWCNVQLRLPLFGNLFRKAFVASLTRTLGALLKGGVPALSALKITKGTMGNIVVQESIQKISDSVEKGGTFADPMYQNRFLFPKMVVLMIQVGETSGKTDEMLEKVSDYYDAEVDEAISAMISAIEPMLTVFMGGLVLFIASSLFLPLFNLSKMMR